VTRRYATPETTYEVQTVDWSPLAQLKCLSQFMLKGHSSQVGDNGVLLWAGLGTLPASFVHFGPYDNVGLW
jgi:hypothetical protein